MIDPFRRIALVRTVPVTLFRHRVDFCRLLSE